MYPDRDTLSNVPRSGYITARDQSMAESGLTEGGKNKHWQFSFSRMKTTSETRSLKLKSTHGTHVRIWKGRAQKRYKMNK